MQSRTAISESGNLDLLRSCAVLSVLASHLLTFFGIQAIGPFAAINLGLAGVSFFFVHTSLVLMMSLERHRRQAGGHGLLGSFYVKRFFRIYPLSVACLLLVCFFQLPAGGLSTGEIHLRVWTAKSLASNLLLMQNLSDSTDLLAVLWSLPIEVQMYLFLPPLFLLTKRRRAFVYLGALWCVLVGLGSLQPHVSIRLNLFRYAPCFLPGVIAYALSKRVHPRLPGWLWAAWAPLLALLSSTASSQEYRWVMCLALGFSVPCFREISFTPLRRVSAWIAKYSYGEYLCHLTCIWFAFERLRGLPSIVQWMVLGFLITAVPVACFHLLESPMIRMGARLADDWFAHGSAERVFPAASKPLSQAAAAASSATADSTNRNRLQPNQG